MTANLEELKTQAVAELDKAGATDQLEAWRVAYLGRKGRLTQVLRALGDLPPDQRRAKGAEANALKSFLEGKLAEKEGALKGSESALRLEAERIDVTAPGRPAGVGRLHPTTQIVREICSAFVAMGFQVVEGPEVEWDVYNFEALNIPQGHPARDMWDTLWIDYADDKGQRPMLLRTHTSPMQIRVMEKQQPPVRVVIPGKVFRYEATDATHESMFYQVEGLAVGEGITFADLKGTLTEFARRIFGAQRKTRFRCDYFPFVEPGAEMAVDCFLCDGKGCRVCKDTGWIEIMGAGMVHPKVLRRVGYDPERYTGFAFGMGPERIAMLKYGIDDIRLFYSNDLRFLRQF
ncbi:MAG: phenylalanine--tRNA ligase subunit alpha [Dehalococcoidia bacterium]|nr:phenylalanine--tRNA ligase subunit alpha [Dehalococcoidia bacterium]